MGECCRQVKAEEVSNSGNEIHQTTYKDFLDCTYNALFLTCPLHKEGQCQPVAKFRLFLSILSKCLQQQKVKQIRNLHGNHKFHDASIPTVSPVHPCAAVALHVHAIQRKRRWGNEVVEEQEGFGPKDERVAMFPVFEANFDIRFEISNLNYPGMYLNVAILVASETMV